MPEDYNFALGPHTYNIYTYDSVTRSVERIVDSYYNINARAVDNFQYFCTPAVGSVSPDPSCPGGSQIEAPVLTFTYYSSSVEEMFEKKALKPVQLGTKTEQFKLTADNIGPFDMRHLSKEEVANNITRMTTAVITFRLKGFVFGEDYRSCVTWDVSILLDFTSRGHISQHIGTEVPGGCEVFDSQSEQLLSRFWRDGVWINLPMCVCALIFLALHIPEWRHIFTSGRAFWVISASLSACFVIISSLMNIVSSRQHSPTTT